MCTSDEAVYMVNGSGAANQERHTSAAGGGRFMRFGMRAIDGCA